MSSRVIGILREHCHSFKSTTTRDIQIFMSLNIFASSVSRLASFTSTKCLPAAFLRSSFQGRPSIRFMSTPQFQSFVEAKDTRHADMTRDMVKDAVDQQVQNRPASSTPDQRWQDRSKRALENVARTPPADTYSGRLFFFACCSILSDYKKVVPFMLRQWGIWPSLTDSWMEFLTATRSVQP